MDEPRENRGLVLEGAGAMRIDVRRARPPTSDEVLVRVDAAGLCGSDLDMAEFSADETRRHRVTGIFAGHEAAGVIVDSARADELGQPVVVFHYEACWSCHACRSGYLQWCPRRQAMSMDRDGGLALFLTIDRRNCLRLPADFSATDGACIACTAGTAGAAVMKLGERLPPGVLVIGAGPLGAATAQLLTGLGVETHVLELDADRRRMIVEHRLASRVSAGVEVGALYDAVIETSGATSARAAAVEHAAPGAKVVLVGLADNTSSLPIRQVVMKEAQVVGSNIWPLTAYEDILDLFRRADVRPGTLVHEVAGLSTAPDVVRAARSSSRKIVFLPHAAER